MEPTTRPENASGRLPTRRHVAGDASGRPADYDQADVDGSSTSAGDELTKDLGLLQQVVEGLEED